MDRRDWNEAAACWAPDARNHASGRCGSHHQQGRDAVKSIFELLGMAFPGRRWEIEDLIAEGDAVACRMTVSGTFGQVPPPPPGPLPDGWVGVESTALIPPAAGGKQYSVRHVHVFRIANGVVAEHWAARDDLALLIQLGAISSPS